MIMRRVCKLFDTLIVQDMHRDRCGGEKNPGICPEMKPYDGELMRYYLLKVEFKGEYNFIEVGGQ